MSELCRTTASGFLASEFAPFCRTSHVSPSSCTEVALRRMAGAVVYSVLVPFSVVESAFRLPISILCFPFYILSEGEAAEERVLAPFVCMATAGYSASTALRCLSMRKIEPFEFNF